MFKKLVCLIVISAENDWYGLIPNFEFTRRVFLPFQIIGGKTRRSCQNVCDALTYLLDNIFFRNGSKLYRQVVGIPMGAGCAPLVADLFLFCYERDFVMSLSDDRRADVIDAFNTTSRYLDNILGINGVYFDNMISQIYPSELQLGKANTSDTEAAFSDLHLSISNDIVSTKIYDKCDDFDFEIVNFSF